MKRPKAKDYNLADEFGFMEYSDDLQDYIDNIEGKLEHSEYMRNNLDVLFDEYIELHKKITKRKLNK